MVNSSPITGIHDGPIEIPRGVKDFFAPRGYYINSQVNYAALFGHAPGVREARIEKSRLSGYDVVEHEFTFSDSKKEQKANQHARNAIKFFFNGGRYSKIKRSVLFKTSSEPVKLRFAKGGKLSKDVVYVKKPDVNRIIGKYLYNIISGYDEARFGFNETAFIEEGISGNPLSSPRINERRYMTVPRYREGVARAAVHAEFLDALSDVVYPANRLVDSNLNTILFDFNLILVQNVDDEGKPIDDPLFDAYAKDYSRVFCTPAINEVYMNEQRAVANRVREHEDEFFTVVGLMGKMNKPHDGLGRTIDEVVDKNFHQGDLKTYLMHKVEEYERV